MSSKIVASSVAVFIALGLVACGQDTVKPPVTAKAVAPTLPPPPAAPVEKKDDAPRTAQAVTNLLGLDSEILRVCNVHVDAPQPEKTATHFDFDESTLSAEDTAILSQVARCLTSGPLAGRHLQLIGRADARGTTEYNFVLGANRAGAVGTYLEQQGVASPRINQTSRGELDATGTNDATMQADRRVDIMLGS